MKKTQLITCDLDGTLLLQSKSVSENSLKVIKELSEKGHYFIPATGRNLSTLPECIKEIDTLEYAITSNGASIINLKTKEKIFGSPIKKEIIEYVINETKGHRLGLEFFNDNYAFCSEEYFELVKKGEIHKQYQDFLLRTRTPYNDIEKFLHEFGHTIENINLNFDDIDLRNHFFKLMSENVDGSVTSSFMFNVEVANKKISKGAALEFMCNYLNVPIENTTAFGDSLNDLEMIKIANTGVAMGNALDQLKEVANYIGETNINDGVSKYIEKFILNS